MKRSLRGFIIFLLYASNGFADEIELEVESGLMLKMLRDMANQTAADSLNLPANASSIRENITDTFSCENRTYGYYADVDNDCQIFHVCLTSQTATGRNVTYRWSFICPNETIFNQEVLVCTRPHDAIDCKDSPNYYYLNMEIGKTPNNTRNTEIEDNTIDEIPIKDILNKKEQVFPSRNPAQKRKPTKQNLVQQLIKDIVDEEMKEKLENIEFTGENIEGVFPVVFGASDDTGIENKDRIVITDERVDASDSVSSNEEDMNRIVLERRMGRNLKRGSMRFKADI